MKISHIALYARDLEAVRDFYLHYFGGTSNRKYENPRTALATYFIDFSGGARVEIMSRPEGRSDARDDFAAGLTHIAFSVGGREAVDALTERLEADGFLIASRPRVTGDGYYESVVLDPEGNRIEITG